MLETFFEPSNPRHLIYRTAHALALEAGAKWQEAIDGVPPGTAPPVPPDLTQWPWNWQYPAWQNGKPNPFAAEQFLVIELGNKIEETWKATPFPPPDASPTAKFPHAVTITEASVRSQFGVQLHRAAIEERARREDQVSAFLDDSGEFVAVTQDGSYIRLALRSVVLEGLMQQMLASWLADSG